MKGMGIKEDFREWILKFKQVDNRVGDLAREVERDHSFPSSDKYEVVKEYLINKKAHRDALDTFEFAYLLYAEDMIEEEDGDQRFPVALTENQLEVVCKVLEAVKKGESDYGVIREINEILLKVRRSID